MSLVQFRPEAPLADLAHLVERNLAKVEVAGSIPVIRSKTPYTVCAGFLFAILLLSIENHLLTLMVMQVVF